MYTYEKFNLRLVPPFLVIIGTLFIATKMYIQGGLLGTIGALFSISFKGFSIDPEKMTIRHYDRFLWFSFGAWKPIPAPQYVTVVRIKLSSRRDGAIPLVLPSEGKSSVSYKMNLVVNSKERYLPLARGNRLDMLEEGLKIARLLNVKLLDHTTCEKRWLA